MIPSDSGFFSMTTGHPCFSYDVFLSFRGEDTRKTFTDHLYAALKQAGIRTFRDDDAMDRGRRLEPELKKAIRESAISIIVFSRNYASSKWCLDEVLTIIEEQERLSSKHEVVPVFYNVEPSDVRNQTGSFEEAFGGYESMIEAETDYQKKIELQEKVKAWRISLKKAGSLTGMVLANEHEAKFISNIVKVIRKKLNCKLLYIEDKLVGIEDNVADIESWLQDPSPNAVFLFIHGMGGIGKTTISKCIFNSNCREYDGSCFLADIHESSNQNNGLLRLQCQLLSNLLRSNKEEVIWNLDEGTIKVRNALCNKKVLLVLDDITTRQQLTALLGPQQFYPGSKVIVTTRDKGLLSFFEVNPKVHAIEQLGPNDSNKLFSLYAFQRDHPIEPYMIQSEHVVRHCRGHPLALKVLGSFLNGKTIDVWEDAMRKLEAIPDPKIQKVLQLSYDTLEETNDQDLFLHIACFFVGEDKEFIVKLLGECDLYPIVGIQNLMDRCLLYIENGRVMMHQLIKEMGQEVVRKESPRDPGKRSRLWHHNDSYNVLKENGGTRKVQGLALDMQRIKGMNSTSIVIRDNGRKRSFEDFSGRTIHTNNENFKVGAIEKMKNLMLLQLDYATFSGSYKKLPRKLRLLRWHGFSLKSIPSDVPFENLVVLDLRYSKLKEVWDGFKVVGSLKILNLSYSVELIKTPDFDGLPRLESLHLEGCLSLNQVCCVKRLPSLKVLKAIKCSHLQKVLDVPKSVTELSVTENMSLEIVQPTPNPLAFLFAGECQNLCAVEGCFKLESIQSVDRKIIRYLGLESISENGTEFRGDKQNAYTEEVSIKVSYEFGIFSTYVSGKTLPCFRSIIRDVEVNNKTKVLVWKYTPTIQITCKKKGEFNYVWLSVWRTDNLLDDGDEIVVSINLQGSDIVEECCADLVYDDDEVGEDKQEEMDEETKDTCCMFNHISWTDKLRVEISDYVHSGKTYCFKIGGATDVPNIDGIYDLIVDWWGLREDWRCRIIQACVPSEI
ncbi:putative TIR domain, P-loop containing nucleoside triphosphate hydrolase [Helianthus annuus]|nr:putative TIR domain, P-loop containing nucleoside triphosphate hydrolase [Helianthus annuus]KAJ0696842.1 putative TIR domain, P-loop containing nucleoside triphosphate hydrolase [Helianthus annuus]